MIPQKLGLCSADVPRLLSYCNEAMQRLIIASGETGFWGGWYRTVFSVASDGTITLPRQVARVVNLAVCDTPIEMQNEFYEFLEAGIGPQTDVSGCVDCCGSMRAFDRGTFPTNVDVSSVDQMLRVYISDTRDLNKHILIKGIDQNGRTIRGTSGTLDVDGLMISFSSPFSDSNSLYSKITGVIKDFTYGDVLLYSVDVNTGVQTLLAIYAPNETNPSYRRYYLSNLPTSCCNCDTGVQVVGMAKLEFTPVFQDTDFLIISNLPALGEECESIRYGGMDNPTAMQMSEAKHRKAVRLLNQELTHYLGKSRPAVTMSVHGTARPEYQSIGTLV
jgi:hypothetical protein